MRVENQDCLGNSASSAYSSHPKRKTCTPAEGQDVAHVSDDIMILAYLHMVCELLVLWRSAKRTNAFTGGDGQFREALTLSLTPAMDGSQIRREDKMSAAQPEKSSGFGLLPVVFAQKMGPRTSKLFGSIGRSVMWLDNENFLESHPSMVGEEGSMSGFLPFPLLAG